MEQILDDDYLLAVANIDALEDLDKQILKVENAIITLKSMEDEDVIADYLKTEDALVHESALAGKKTVLEKLGNIKDKFLAHREEVTGGLGEIIKKSKALKGYKDIITKLESGDHVSVDKYGGDDLQILKLYTGFMEPMGYDISKPKDLLAFIEYYPTYMKDIHGEIAKVLKKLWNSDNVGMFVTKEDVAKLYKAGKISAPKSVDMVKKLKLNIKEGREVVMAFPMKLIAPSLSLTIVTYDKNTGSVHVDTEVIKGKKIPDFKPYEIDDLIKIAKASQVHVDKMGTTTTALHKDIRDILKVGVVETRSLLLSGSVDVLVSNLNSMTKLLTNFGIATNNLVLYGFDNKALVEQLVKRSIRKK